MADVYKKAGRGGAGNFYNKKSASVVVAKTHSVGAPTSSMATAQRKKDDRETAISPQETNDLARALISSKPTPDYLHTGRGGAGNMVKPSGLAGQGLEQMTSADATSPTSPNVSISKRVLGVAKPSYRGGRGGAGSYADSAGEEKVRREEEERMRVATEERITRDVERGLSKPPLAYGERGGTWEMRSME